MLPIPMTEGLLRMLAKCPEKAYGCSKIVKFRHAVKLNRKKNTKVICVLGDVN